MNEKPDNQLSQALRALAAADLEQEAPPAVEAALLKALRQPLVPKTARVIAFPKVWALRRPVLRYALAAAAMLLLCLGWLSWRAGQTAPAQKEVAVKTAVPPPTPVAQAAPERANVETAVVDQKQIVRAARKRSPIAPRPQPAEAAFTEEEIATEFFPLVTTNALPERGQMVRVKVPRSTLINFGLPVNAERTEIPINADLLVGEDGAARAIRFVQERLPQEAVMNVYGKTMPASYRKR